MTIELDLAVYQIAYTIVVIIFCGLAVMGIPVALIKLNEYRNKQYSLKKIRLSEKLEIKKLKKELRKITLFEETEEETNI